MSISTRDMRRLALNSQGLLKRAPFGRGLNAVHKAVNQLGYVQIDTISVVDRAHHHILRTRVP
ncbi:MAG TPA: winged helix-turn-helix domain-containing protein, partial [Pseudomonadales bacterium]|nr:winged helix-turn-helix domain-containing protein [Pseudomonadales bacterium]